LARASRTTIEPDGDLVNGGSDLGGKDEEEGLGSVVRNGDKAGVQLAKVEVYEREGLDQES
jgi:hypothetical protein